MNSFSIFAHGELFDVDAYLASTTLRPDYVWRRGDQRRYSCAGSKHTTNGVELLLGNGRVVPLFQQHEIAIDYLKAHRDELRALAEYPGMETFVIGFHYRLNPDATIGFCIGTPALLMWHALDVGAKVNHYVWIDRQAD